MSGLAGLLKGHGGKSKAHRSNEDVRNIYSKAQKRTLPPENEILFDGDLKLFLMDGFVFSCTRLIGSRSQHFNSPCRRFFARVLAGHGTQGA
jgi:hypothetical protein